MAQIHFEIDDDTHRRFKVRCAERDMTMSGWIRACIRGLVDDDVTTEYVEWLQERDAVREGE